MATVRCPECGCDREVTATDIRREVKRRNFRGYCRPCAVSAVGAGRHRYLNYRRRPKAHHVSAAGYLLVSPQDVPDELLPMFRAMQRCGQPVFEHRWVMAKTLGRPLRSDELVDHRDGVKTHNEPGNLRIYLRGRQQPGSAPGWGTFYHEWQMAERRIADLEAKLRSLARRPR